jgi:hypothetical protein
MPKIKHTATTVTTRTVQKMSYTAEELCQALDLPPNARLTVHVPGGGDWSDEDLQLDGNVRLDVRVETVKETKG